MVCALSLMPCCIICQHRVNVCVVTVVKDSPLCSPSGSLVQCVVGNPLKQGAIVTTQIRLDASHLPATRHPLYIAVNVTTLVSSVHLCLWNCICCHSLSFELNVVSMVGGLTLHEAVQLTENRGHWRYIVHNMGCHATMTLVTIKYVGNGRAILYWGRNNPSILASFHYLWKKQPNVVMWGEWNWGKAQCFG